MFPQNKETKGISMKKVNYKIVRSFLILLLVAQSINFVAFKGLQIVQAKLGNYVFESMTEPFLNQEPSIVQK